MQTRLLFVERRLFHLRPSPESVKRARLLAVCAVIAGAMSSGGCGDQGSTGKSDTPASSVTSMTVSCNEASVPVNQQVQCVAAVEGSGNFSKAVSWSVNGIPGGNSAVGTVDTSGLYTAPGSVPTPFTMTVAAASEANPAVSASASVIVAGTMASVQQTVSAASGGTITLPDGSSVTIAPGVLPADESITLSELSLPPTQPPNPATGDVGAGLVLSFSNPVQLNAAAKARLAQNGRSQEILANDAGSAIDPIRFSLNTASDPVALLTGSVPFAAFTDSSNANIFLGVLGSVDSAANAVTGGIDDLTLSGLPAQIASIEFGAVNFVRAAAHTAETPYRWSLDASTSTWTQYSSCPASGKTLVAVHGMLSSVKDTFSASDGTIANIQKAGGYQNVVGFDYDWLQSVETSGTQLAAFLDTLAACPGLTLDIEAHSEGVPVSLSALTQTNATVRRLIAVAGPIMGTPMAADARALEAYVLMSSVVDLPSDFSPLSLAAAMTAPFVADLAPDSATLSAIRSDLAAASANNAPQIILVAGDKPQIIGPFGGAHVPMGFLSPFMGTANFDGVVPLTSALAFGSRLKAYPLPPFTNLGHNDLVSDSPGVQPLVGAQVQATTAPSLEFVSPSSCDTDLSCTADMGTVFSFGGADYSANGQVVAYELSSSGDSIPPKSDPVADGNGEIPASGSSAWSDATACSDVAAVKLFFAVDQATARSSNAVTEDETGGSCASENPAPVISSLDPSSLPAGSGATTISINGSGFLASSVVTFNGAAHAVTFQSSSQLEISLTANDLAAQGSFPVVITNPGPGGGNSNTDDFLVVSGAVGTVTVSPESVTVRESAFQTFVATVSGGGGVVWSVAEGDAGGTITSEGVYQAPLATGTFHVVATNATDGSQSATAIITVVPLAAPGIISTVAGGGFGCSEQTDAAGDGCPGSLAWLVRPGGVATDHAGNLYIADTGNSRIRVVNVGNTPITVAGVTVQPGTVGTVAGNGTEGYAGDGGPASSAELNSPGHLTLDAAGDIFISDSYNHVVRLVNVQSSPITYAGVIVGPGGVATIAGGGTGCANETDMVGDGCPATAAVMNLPDGVTLGPDNTLYIADYDDERIREVNASTGIISTVAGDGFGGFSGDGGPAISAELYGPSRVAIDAKGNLYISDYYNNRVRRVDGNTHVITTVAGTGAFGYAGDGGPATSAGLSPLSIALDAAGNVYIADYSNERIRAVNTQASTITVLGVSVPSGAIETVAGIGSAGYTGDGNAATAAALDGPTGLWFDQAGNLYFADSINSVIRKVTGP